jgi:hypothetical protein
MNTENTTTEQTTEGSAAQSVAIQPAQIALTSDAYAAVLEVLGSGAFETQDPAATAAQIIHAAKDSPKDAALLATVGVMIAGKKAVSLYDLAAGLAVDSLPDAGSNGYSLAATKSKGNTKTGKQGALYGFILAPAYSLADLMQTEAGLKFVADKIQTAILMETSRPCRLATDQTTLTLDDMQNAASSMPASVADLVEKSERAARAENGAAFVGLAAATKAFCATLAANGKEKLAELITAANKTAPNAFRDSIRAADYHAANAHLSRIQPDTFAKLVQFFATAVDQIRANAEEEAAKAGAEVKHTVKFTGADIMRAFEGREELKLVDEVADYSAEDLTL